MSQDKLKKVQWADATFAEALEQMSHQINSMDTLTDSTVARLSTLQEKVKDNPLASQEIAAAITALQHSTQQQHTNLQRTLQQLQQRVHQLNILLNVANQYGDTVGLDRVLTTTIDAVWQKMPPRFAVIVLGETELGPYTYHATRGVPGSSQFLNKSCPFPLWGILARALLPRLNEDEPDYLIVNDIDRESLPLPSEFPWMPRNGSLMILPLRAEKRAQGAILLGHEKVSAFADPMLRTDLLAIARQTERVLQLTQMQHELNTRSGQLLSLQLFTKSIAGAKNYDKLVDVLVESIGEALGQVGVTIIFNQQVWHRDTEENEPLSPHIRRIIEWTMQAGQPIFYDPEDTEGTLERFYYNETGHALVVPILRNEQTQGAIQISTKESSRRFEEGDMIVLRTIANCVAIILHDMNQ
ncbi:MAG: GAF domain-containing protein [Caldilineaceae bacterium]|nr:GAF domain-containing protein [Caldilineaceae bacterium]